VVQFSQSWKTLVVAGIAGAADFAIGIVPIGDADADRDTQRHLVIVLLRVEHVILPHLPQVAGAGGRPGAGAGLGEGGQKQPDEQRDDPDDHQQLSEREGRNAITTVLHATSLFSSDF